MAKRSVNRTSAPKRARGKRRRHEVDGTSGDHPPPAEVAASSRIVSGSSAPPGAHPPKPRSDSRRLPAAPALWPSTKRLPEPATSTLPPPMADALSALRHEWPTEMQRHCWPCCLSGSDVVGCAPTGSGKTLCYALPLVELFGRWPNHRALGAPRALILVPTRELAQQVAHVCAAMLRPSAHQPAGRRVAAVYGGEARDTQLAALKVAPALDVLVATPGRLLDLSSEERSTDGGGGGGVDLSAVRYVVLDEADKLLLSAGLAEQVAALHARTNVRAPPQTLLFSATMPEGLPSAAASLLAEPMVVDMQQLERRRAAGASGPAGAAHGAPHDAHHGADLAEDEGDEAAVVAPSSGTASFQVHATVKQLTLTLTRTLTLTLPGARHHQAASPDTDPNHQN